MLNSGFPIFIDCDLLVFCQFGVAKITNNGKQKYELTSFNKHF